MSLIVWMKMIFLAIDDEKEEEEKGKGDEVESRVGCRLSGGAGTFEGDVCYQDREGTLA